MMPCIVDSDNARQFLQDTFKMDILDVVRKMEYWNVNRTKSTYLIPFPYLHG